MPGYSFVKVGTNSSNSNVLSFTPTNNSDLLLVMSQTSAGAGGPTASIADNLTSSYSTALSTTSFSGTSWWWTFWYLPISSTSITTMTITYTGGTPGTCVIAAFEYSGLSTSSPLIAASSITNVTGPGTGTDAVTGPTINVTPSPAMLWGVTYDNSNNTSQVAGTGFTRRDNGNTLLNANMLPEDKRVTSTGNAKCTWTDGTHGGADQYFMFSMAFKEASQDTPITTGSGGGISISGVSPTVTPAQNTVIKPFVARKSGLLEPDRRLFVPTARKIFLPTYLKRAA